MEEDPDQEVSTSPSMFGVNKHIKEGYFKDNFIVLVSKTYSKLIIAY